MSFFAPLVGIALDGNSNPIPGAVGTFATDNALVATVDAFGEVTAVGLGTCHITWLTGGQTASCTITVSAGGSTPSDLVTLISALGGNGVVPAAYDVRNGLVLSGANVTAWQDARGASGFGPAFAAGTVQPTWDGITLNIVSGTTDAFATPASALFDLSQAITVVFVGAYSAGTGFGGIVDNAGTVIMTMKAVSGNFGIQIGATTSSQTAAAISATRRMFLYGKDGASTANYKLQCAAKPVISGTVANFAAGNRQLSLNHYMTAVSQLGVMTANIRALLVLNRLWSTADETAIDTWAVNNHTTVDA